MGLLDRLVPIVPPALSRFFFANSGSEAVDQAIKIARGHTGKQNIICFEVGGILLYFSASCISCAPVLNSSPDLKKGDVPCHNGL